METAYLISLFFIFAVLVIVTILSSVRAKRVNASKDYNAQQKDTPLTEEEKQARADKLKQRLKQLEIDKTKSIANTLEVFNILTLILSVIYCLAMFFLNLQTIIPVRGVYYNYNKTEINFNAFSYLFYIVPVLFFFFAVKGLIQLLNNQRYLISNK